jgi:regulator of ribonuclease activity A
MTAPYFTTDLADANPTAVQRLTSPLRNFGKRQYFHGPVRTVVTMRDTKLAQQLFRTLGKGAVIVLDGGGATDTALLGDINADILVQNGWAGVVINGAVRDSAALSQLDLGIKALATTPFRSGKSGIGAVDVPVAFGGILFTPGQHIYCDPDGVLVSNEALPLPPVSPPSTYET